VVDFVEICNVCARKAIIECAKRIINSDKVCRSYSDLNFGVTFLEHSVYQLSVQNASISTDCKNGIVFRCKSEQSAHPRYDL